jgi:hypothetical protein
MPLVTFTVRRGLSAAVKSRLSEAMLEAQVAAGYRSTLPKKLDRPRRFSSYAARPWCWVVYQILRSRPYVSVYEGKPCGTSSPGFEGRRD